MKKLFYFLLLSLGAGTLHAQNPTFSPAVFTAEDEVTLTVDVTGTAMAGATEAYIWMWGSAGDSPLNTSWTNSPNAARMTAAGTNKWSFTFTATILWGRPPADLTSFSFLVKKKDGSAQTPDYSNFAFDPLIFIPTMLRVFPTKVSNKDLVTINFDRSLGGTVNEQRMTPVSATVTAYNEAGTQVGSAITLPVRLLATNIWAATFDPRTRFNPGAGHSLAKFRYRFNGTVLDTNGATVNVSSSEAEYTFANLD